MSAISDTANFVTRSLETLSLAAPAGYAQTVNGKVLDARGSWPLANQSDPTTVRAFATAIAQELRARGHADGANAALARAASF